MRGSAPMLLRVTNCEAETHPFVVCDCVNNGRSCHFRFRSAYHARLKAPSLIISGQDFRNTPMRDAKLPGDITRTDSVVSQFHDAGSDYVRKWSAIHEHATQLIDTAMACK